MKGLAKYGAVATKIRAMRAKLLTTEDYTSLAASSSPRDIAVYLKEHSGYQTALEPLDTESFRRAHLERLLVGSVLYDIKKIYRYLDKAQKHFLELYQKSFEIRLLKNVMRDLFNKDVEPTDLKYTVFPTVISESFTYENVSSAKTLDELLTAVKNSEYYSILTGIRDKFEHPSLFDYEMALDMYYFKSIWAAAQTLPEIDREAIQYLHGTEIDMLNILWIYRTKAYYKVPVNYIVTYIIPVTCKLKKTQLSELMMAEDAEAVMKMLKGTEYGKYIDPDDPSSLERMYAEKQEHDNRQARKNYPYSLAVATAYIFDKRIEIENIISIAESVRYGYSPKSILKNLNIGGGQ